MRHKKKLIIAFIGALLLLLTANCATMQPNNAPTATQPATTASPTPNVTVAASPSPAANTNFATTNNALPPTESRSTETRQTVRERTSNGRTTRVARTSTATSDGSRQAYYDYQPQPRHRSFFQKHRDKITVAGGAAGGALLGGLIGGKKGAAIGAITGGGGSALYTYKIRKKRRPPQ